MNKRIKRKSFKFTEKESEEIESLLQHIQEDLDISKQRTSELCANSIIEGLKQFSSSYIPTTQTKPQSVTAERKEAIHDMIDTVRDNSFMFYGEAYANLIYGRECFSDVKFRTKANYFQNFLISEDLFFIYLPNYIDTDMKNPILILHRQSKWFPQLKELCFQIKEPIFKLTHDQMNEQKLRDTISDKLKRKATYKPTLDKAERVMLNSLLYECKILTDKPIYDNTDLTLQEVISLRSQFKFNEAKDLLEREKQHYQQQRTSLNDDEMNVLAIKGGDSQ